MAGGFGFSDYASQRPAPNAQAVGMALVSRRMTPPAPTLAPAAAFPMDAAGPVSQELAGDAAMRVDGAMRMGARGQIDDVADDPFHHSANATNVAIGEALTRMGGGYTTNPNPFKNRTGNAQRLQQLGVSSVEAALLVRTGGV